MTLQVDYNFAIVAYDIFIYTGAISLILSIIYFIIFLKTPELKQRSVFIHILIAYIINSLLYTNEGIIFVVKKSKIINTPQFWNWSFLLIDGCKEEGSTFYFSYLFRMTWNIIWIVDLFIFFYNKNQKHSKLLMAIYILIGYGFPIAVVLILVMQFSYVFGVVIYDVALVLKEETYTCSIYEGTRWTSFFSNIEDYIFFFLGFAILSILYYRKNKRQRGQKDIKLDLYFHLQILYYVFYAVILLIFFIFRLYERISSKINTKQIIFSILGSGLGILFSIYFIPCIYILKKSNKEFLSFEKDPKFENSITIHQQNIIHQKRQEVIYYLVEGISMIKNTLNMNSVLSTSSQVGINNSAVPHKSAGLHVVPSKSAIANCLSSSHIKNTVAFYEEIYEIDLAPKATIHEESDHGESIVSLAIDADEPTVIQFFELAPAYFSFFRSLEGISEGEIKDSFSNHFINSLKVISTSEQLSILGADGRFILKSISEAEFEKLREMLPNYFEFIKKNSNSVLSPILGCFSISLNFRFPFILLRNYESSKSLISLSLKENDFMAKRRSEPSHGKDVLVGIKNLESTETVCFKCSEFKSNFKSIHLHKQAKDKLRKMVNNNIDYLVSENITNFNIQIQIFNQPFLSIKEFDAEYFEIINQKENSIISRTNLSDDEYEPVYYFKSTNLQKKNQIQIKEINKFQSIEYFINEKDDIDIMNKNKKYFLIPDLSIENVRESLLTSQSNNSPNSLMDPFLKKKNIPTTIVDDLKRMSVIKSSKNESKKEGIYVINFNQVRYEPIVEDSSDDEIAEDQDPNMFTPNFVKQTSFTPTNLKRQAHENHILIKFNPKDQSHILQSRFIQLVIDIKQGVIYRRNIFIEICDFLEQYGKIETDSKLEPKIYANNLKDKLNSIL